MKKIIWKVTMSREKKENPCRIDYVSSNKNISHVHIYNFFSHLFFLIKYSSHQLFSLRLSFQSASLFAAVKASSSSTAFVILLFGVE